MDPDYVILLIYIYTFKKSKLQRVSISNSLQPKSIILQAHYLEMPDQKKSVVIVGGSLGGLFTGVVFTRLGYNVTILERTPEAALQDQGAGISLWIVIPPIAESLTKLGISGSPIVDFLAEYDRTKTPTLCADGIHYLNRDGSIKMQVDGVGQVASWDLLYNILRANFDGGYATGYVNAAEKKESDGKATYLSGMRVTDLQEVGSDRVKVEYENTDGSKGSLEADVVVGADGPNSTVRKLLLPEVERSYAGYVAWRGIVQESLLSETTRTFIGSKVCLPLRSYIYSYLCIIVLHDFQQRMPDSQVSRLKPSHTSRT
jgi:2-polyprenyl-6-methoxyphenol hydroxylase-like FAD-dependent oxidoreductase